MLTLEDGRIYDEQSGGPRSGGNYPLLRGRFQQEEVRIDLSGLEMKRTNEDLFKDHYKMLTLGQLGYAEDSLRTQMAHRMADQDMGLRNTLAPLRKTGRSEYVDVSRRAIVMPVEGAADVRPRAADLARNAMAALDRIKQEREDRKEQIAKFEVEWHRKPMLAFACVVFFFIGAPLGAIVRKGGMGLPAVIAIIFFLVFHILSYSTEQMVKSGSLPAWPGMWISTLVLLPVGIFLTWKAATDSPLFDRDAYARAWSRFRAIFARNARPPVVQ